VSSRERSRWLTSRYPRPSHCGAARLLGEQHPDTLNSYRRLASLRQRLLAAEEAGAVGAARSADGDAGGAAELRAGEEPREVDRSEEEEEEEDGEEEEADQTAGYEQ